MQQSKTMETWVGLFVALGMVGLFFLAMKVSNLGDLQTREDSYKVTARFQNAGSLRERAPVSMGGVRIGRVSAIRFDKKTYEAVVEMRIDPEYDTIPEDTTANILTAGLLGEQYIGLSAGGSDEYLKNGSEIELTQSALVLEEVISRFLFNKAEGGAEKKDAPQAGVSGDEAADTAIVDAVPPVKKGVAADNGEEDAAPANKAKPAGGEEAKVAHKPKAAHGKAAEPSHAAVAAKPSPAKAKDGADAAGHKPAKSSAPK